IWKVSKSDRSRSWRFEIQHRLPQRLRNGARPLAKSAESNCAWSKIFITGNRLKPFAENAQPVSAQKSFDVGIGEAPLNQFAGKISGVRMICQIGNEMGRR